MQLAVCVWTESDESDDGDVLIHNMNLTANADGQKDTCGRASHLNAFYEANLSLLLVTMVTTVLETSASPSG